MSYKIKQIGEENKPTIARDTRVGDLMKVTDEANGNAYKGHFLLHIYEGFVSLNDPDRVWNERCALEVQLLPSGTEITLVVD